MIRFGNRWLDRDDSENPYLCSDGGGADGDGGGGVGEGVAGSPAGYGGGQAEGISGAAATGVGGFGDFSGGYGSYGGGTDAFGGAAFGGFADASAAGALGGIGGFSGFGLSGFAFDPNSPLGQLEQAAARGLVNVGLFDPGVTIENVPGVEFDPFEGIQGIEAFSTPSPGFTSPSPGAPSPNVDAPGAQSSEQGGAIGGGVGGFGGGRGGGTGAVGGGRGGFDVASGPTGQSVEGLGNLGGIEFGPPAADFGPSTGTGTLGGSAGGPSLEPEFDLNSPNLNRAQRDLIQIWMEFFGFPPPGVPTPPSRPSTQPGRAIQLAGAVPDFTFSLNPRSVAQTFKDLTSERGFNQMGALAIAPAEFAAQLGFFSPMFAPNTFSQRFQGAPQFAPTNMMEMLSQTFSKGLPPAQPWGLPPPPPPTVPLPPIDPRTRPATFQERFSFQTPRPNAPQPVPQQTLPSPAPTSRVGGVPTGIPGYHNPAYTIGARFGLPGFSAQEGTYEGYLANPGPVNPLIAILPTLGESILAERNYAQALGAQQGGFSTYSPIATWQEAVPQMALEEYGRYVGQLTGVPGAETATGETAAGLGRLSVPVPDIELLISPDFNPDPTVGFNLLRQLGLQRAQEHSQFMQPFVSPDFAERNWTRFVPELDLMMVGGPGGPLG